MSLKNCVICQKVIERRKKNESSNAYQKKKFCSRICSGISRIGTKRYPNSGRKTRNDTLSGTCVECNVLFFNKKGLNGRYRDAKSFLARKFCSKECVISFNKRNPPGFGKKRTPGQRKKMSLSQVGLFAREKHYLWKSDRTKLKKSEKKHLDGQYRDWALSVKNRDSWECRMKNEDCSGRLEAHHILRWVDYPELRYKINNGITLCQAHHPRKRAEEKRLAPMFSELVSVSREIIC